LPIHGYLSKEMKPCELTAALNRIMDGQILFQTLMAPAGVTAFSPSALRNLTAREAEILRGLVNGDNNRMIANRLSLSEALVKASARQLFRKIKAADRKRAALRATER
jgi:two-component system nitrate/nitrite response regulator NarL